MARRYIHGHSDTTTTHTQSERQTKQLTYQGHIPPEATFRVAATKSASGMRLP